MHNNKQNIGIAQVKYYCKLFLLLLNIRTLCAKFRTPSAVRSYVSVSYSTPSSFAVLGPEFVDGKLRNALADLASYLKASCVSSGPIRFEIKPCLGSCAVVLSLITHTRYRLAPLVRAVDFVG